MREILFEEDVRFQPRIEVFRGDELINNLARFSEITSDIAQDGFGPEKQIDSAGMAGKLLKENNLIMAYDGEVGVGFSTQVLLEFGDKKLLYYSRAIRKSHQGRGLAKILLSKGIEIFSPQIVSARSQNPAEILSFIDFSHNLGAEVHPFDNFFSNKSAETLMSLTNHLKCSDKTDMRTGVCKNSYKEGRLGDYFINIDHPKIAGIEEKLKTFGLNRNNGDSIFYMSFLTNN